jgi:hypothetical protein
MENDPEMQGSVFAKITDTADQSSAPKITDFSQLGREITKITEQMGKGATGTILEDVIYVTVKTKTGPTLTLIDLPGEGR